MDVTGGTLLSKIAEALFIILCMGIGLWLRGWAYSYHTTSLWDIIGDLYEKIRNRQQQPPPQETNGHLFKNSSNKSNSSNESKGSNRTK